MEDPPEQHLPHFVEAAEGQQHQDGLGLLVDLRGAEVLGPTLQHVGALRRVQTHLRRRQRDTEVGDSGLGFGS